MENGNIYKTLKVIGFIIGVIFIPLFLPTVILIREYKKWRRRKKEKDNETKKLP